MNTEEKTITCPYCGGEGRTYGEYNPDDFFDCYRCATTGQMTQAQYEAWEASDREREAEEAENPPLWWDDASYIAYQIRGLDDPPPTEEECEAWDKEYLDSLTPAELAEETAKRERWRIEDEQRKEAGRKASVLEFGFRLAFEEFGVIGWAKPRDLKTFLDDPFADMDDPFAE